jgi:uncharacterized protein VirK/YbjX
MWKLAMTGLPMVPARLRKAAWIVLHPHTFFRVATALASARIRYILQTEPRLVFKYLGPYIAAHLSRRERASILIDHYTFIGDRLGEDFLRKVVDSRLELWRQDGGKHAYRIVLTFPRSTHDEGDLALIFEADGIDIYTLGFAIGPASISGVLDSRALYIARVQGKAKGLPLIRDATRDCLDVSPAWTLLAAAEGIATALKIRHLLGVGAANQIAAGKDVQPEDLVRAYDDFWVAAGGLKLNRNLYHLPVPAALKPIHAIQRDHRRRAMRKREFRSLVTQRVCTAIRELGPPN